MHRIDGPGATADGKFTEGDPVAGVQATVVTDDFLNDVQEELISVLAAAGVSPVKGTQDQVLQAIYKFAQNQKSTAFTTAGTSTALTLTPAPAIPAYTAPLRFHVKFSVSSGLNPTLNVSAKGPKFLMQYDASGAKVAAAFFADQVSDVIYDGVDFVLLDQLPSNSVQRRQSLRGQAVNWKSSADGLSSSYICSADSVILANTAGDTTVVDNIALTLNTAATASATVDGMATGAVAASTWYNVYVWQNSATGVKRVTGDNNHTTGLAPTPPAAGFDLWAKRGSFRTDGTANKYPLRFIQTGDRVQWGVAASSNSTSLRMMTSGGATNTAVPLAAFVPNSARTIQVLLVQVTASAACVAPNSSYGTYNDNVNPPPVSTYFIGGSGGATSKLPGDFVIEGPNIYWTSTNEKLFCLGYEDSL
ncbi:hypothetical protein [Pseudomonas sp. MPB23]|uniref:hypothetical protein n=1 Tax=Pseudomonas sp. MPB23 TaxID=3388490 RepID=UPI003984659B